MKKDFRKVKAFTILICGLIILYINKTDVVIFYQKMLGYQVDYFIHPSTSNLSIYEDFTPNIDTLNFYSKKAQNILYISGRNINSTSEYEEKGYTKNLLNSIKSYASQRDYNLFYYQTAHEEYFLDNSDSTNEIDFSDLNHFIEVIEGDLIVIGMSYGGYLTEQLACKNKSIKGISIGGSLRNSQLDGNYNESNLSKPNCIKSKNLHHIIGNRDGEFEKNKNRPKNLNSYKGHHYITDESINLILKKITEFESY